MSPSADEALELAVHAEEDDPDDEPRGTIRLDAAVVASCPAVRDIHPAADEGQAWLRAMRAVARCTSDAAMANHRLVLRGPARPQHLTMSLLSHLGVPETRVVSLAPTGACEDDCDASDRKVEIGITDTDIAM